GTLHDHIKLPNEPRNPTLPRISTFVGVICAATTPEHRPNDFWSPFPKPSRLALFAVSSLRMCIPRSSMNRLNRHDNRYLKTQKYDGCASQISGLMGLKLASSNSAMQCKM
ncbi:unnamed protein product, partial [Mycena citricolor]